MTPFNIIEILQNTTTLPAGLQFLGYLWIPALLVGYYYVYRNPPQSFNELAKAALGLMLIFFLTRTWLSEPNFNLIIVLALFALTFKQLNFRNFAFLWSYPTYFHVSKHVDSSTIFLGLTFSDICFSATGHTHQKLEACSPLYSRGNTAGFRLEISY